MAKIMHSWLKDTYITQKDTVHFQPEDNHETIIAKREKFENIFQVQTRVENHFSFLIFYSKQRRLKH